MLWRTEDMPMKRVLTTCALLALAAPVLRADVTVTTVTTLEGGMSAMVGGAAPRIVMRIKGTKARSDVEAMGQMTSILVDLTTRRVVLLRPDQKSAQTLDQSSAGAVPANVTVPKIDGTFSATGRTQLLEGVMCEEYAFTISVPMSEMGQSAQMPPEAAGMLKDVNMQMKGSIWTTKVGPAAAEYIAFQKAALAAQLGSVLTGGTGGMSSSGMERVMRAFSGGGGMPYLTEMTMTFEGTGPAVDMMKQMGGMKITSKVTGVSTNAIPDDLFTVPADYTIVKH
jgi:hypothetical protein